MARATVYGGVGEIGGNKILVEEGDSRILLDFGMSFGKFARYYSEFVKPRSMAALRDLLALDLLPAIDGIYRQDACHSPGAGEFVDLELQQEAPDLFDAPVQSYEDYREAYGRPFVDGVVLTHAHLDHFGHFGYLGSGIPLYTTPITAAMVNAIQDLSDTGFEGELVRGEVRTVAAASDRSTFPGEASSLNRRQGAPTWAREVYAQAPYEPFQVGAFRVTLIPVDHSVPGATSVLVETPSGRRIYYTGDIRFHGTFDAITDELRRQVKGLRPNLMLCEGTRITEKSQDSERDVERELTERFRSVSGLCLVDFGWKDTTRFETLRRVADAVGRTLVISHKVAYVLHRLRQTDPVVKTVEDYSNVRVFLNRADTMLYSMADYNTSSGRLQLGYHYGDWKLRDPATDLVHFDGGIRATDIRRNPARYILMLGEFQMNQLPDLAPPSGSVFVRAACEPFDIEMELDLQRQATWLQKYGIPVRMPDDSHGCAEPFTIHASGHACGTDLLDFVKLVQPERVAPIHTEHAEMFNQQPHEVQAVRLGEPVEV